MPRVCFKPSKAPLGKSPDSCPQQEAFCDVESAYLSRSIFCPFGTFPTCYHGPLLPPSATHPTNCSVSLLSEPRSDVENPWLGSCPARSLGLSSLAHLFLRTQSWADPHKNIKGAAVVSNSVQPPRRQPTRLPRPWASPGKNSGVGCHFLLQCMKVKSEREVAQSCPTLSDPMDCSPPGSSVHGIFQARVPEWGGIPTNTPN